MFAAHLRTNYEFCKENILHIENLLEISLSETRNHTLVAVLRQIVSASFETIQNHPAGDVLWISVEPGNVVP